MTIASIGPCMKHENHSKNHSSKSCINHPVPIDDIYSSTKEIDYDSKILPLQIHKVFVLKH